MEQHIEKKYIPLSNYFQSTQQSTIQLSFTEIENILGQKLPNASYLNKSWWLKTKSPLKHFLAWTMNGYQVTAVQPGYYVTFHKPMQYENSGETTDDAHAYPFIIRQAELDDARDIVFLGERLSLKMFKYPYGQQHQKYSVQSLRKSIAEWKVANTSIMLLAIVRGEIGGYLFLEGYHSPYLKHRATLTIDLLDAHTNKGIGTKLMASAEEWAVKNQLRRLELNVAKTNEAAIALFKKFDYVVEGECHDAILIDDHFENELIMSKTL